MLVELGSERHGMDGYGLAVVVEDDDFKEAAGSVSADVEVAVALIEHADGVAYRVLDVEITDAMFTGVVRDLHGCRLACPGGQGKLPCHPTGSAARRPSVKEAGTNRQVAGLRGVLVQDRRHRRPLSGEPAVLDDRAVLM
jgi:hypothetical protein